MSKREIRRTSPWHYQRIPRSSNDKNPGRYVLRGTWPQAILIHDAPLSAYCGLLLARDLDHLMTARGQSLRDIAGRAGVAHSTVARVLTGEVLPDIGTLIRLEDTLDRQLWPGPHAVRAAAQSAEGRDRCPTPQG
ncbi:helix-turn-helix domain-containing protein [Streptomyces sp. NPDC093598]|uniref:helix-turn-helix domain-containing protein n=1 Tax=Streptomyces sp. NPDC093598 TaxID=3366046 RepID=UPI003809BC70